MTIIDQVRKAVEGCNYVIHNAHPNPVLKPKQSPTDKDLIIPAVKGMENILNVCEELKVKRLIVTLCIPNIVGNLHKHKSGETMYSHKDYAPIEKDMEIGPLSKLN